MTKRIFYFSHLILTCNICIVFTNMGFSPKAFLSISSFRIERSFFFLKWNHKTLYYFFMLFHTNSPAQWIMKKVFRAKCPTFSFRFLGKGVYLIAPLLIWKHCVEILRIQFPSNGLPGACKMRCKKWGSYVGASYKKVPSLRISIGIIYIFSILWKFLINWKNKKWHHLLEV